MQQQSHVKKNREKKKINQRELFIQCTEGGDDNFLPALFIAHAD